MGSHLSYHCAPHASYTAAAKVTATASGTTTALAAAALVASLKQRVCDWPQLTLSPPHTFSTYPTLQEQGSRLAVAKKPSSKKAEQAH